MRRSARIQLRALRRFALSDDLDYGEDSESLGDPEDGWVEDALHWGCWQYNEKEGALAFIRDQTQWVYGVPLRELVTPHGVLLWLAQLSDKSWMTPPILGDFVAGVDEIVGLRNLSDAAGNSRITVLPISMLKARRAAQAQEIQFVRDRHPSPS
jgi:hypothetical protein